MTMAEQHQHDRHERSLAESFRELIADGTLDPVIDTVDSDVARQVHQVWGAMDTQREAMRLSHSHPQEPGTVRAAEYALEAANKQVEESNILLTQLRNAARKRLSSSE
jgi:hypothetical protein